MVSQVVAKERSEPTKKEVDCCPLLPHHPKEVSVRPEKEGEDQPQLYLVWPEHQENLGVVKHDCPEAKREEQEHCHEGDCPFAVTN